MISVLGFLLLRAFVPQSFLLKEGTSGSRRDLTCSFLTPTVASCVGWLPGDKEPYRYIAVACPKVTAPHTDAQNEAIVWPSKLVSSLVKGNRKLPYQRKASPTHYFADWHGCVGICASDLRRGEAEGAGSHPLHSGPPACPRHALIFWYASRQARTHQDRSTPR